MIVDSETNYLYLADCLAVKHPSFSRDFEQLLNQHTIPFSYLPQSKDIWARDYMPIQVHQNSFVQFTYYPDYLQSTEWKATISDGAAICRALGLDCQRSTLVLDGGNLIKANRKIVLTDKVFSENSNKTKSELIREVSQLLEVEKVIVVPKQPYDIIGHADGMLRFINDDTVLINDYSRESKHFQRTFRKSLEAAGLSCIELPYNPYHNKNTLQAQGTYINYLEMTQAIVLPLFDLPEDEKAVRLVEELFPQKPIITFNCNEIAEQGGVLNCISWNIFKP